MEIKKRALNAGRTAALAYKELLECVHQVRWHHHPICGWWGVDGGGWMDGVWVALGPGVQGAVRIGNSDF